MNIVVISTASLQSPPEGGGYAGIERVAALCARGLLERGHHVALVAKRGSNNPFGYELIEVDRDSEVVENISAINERMGGVDVYIDYSHDKLLSLFDSSLPIISVYQVMSVTGVPINPVCISRGQHDTKMPQLNAEIIYQPIDLDEFIPNYDARKNFGLYMGQKIPEKQVHFACEVAISSGVPLIVRGPGWGDPSYHDKLRKYQEDYPDLITVGGEAAGQERLDLLREAKFLIHPVGGMGWCESGGIVVLEALASGTPVVVSNNGALGEYVVNGYNGYVCNSQDEMESAVYKILDEHPLVYHCRKSAEPFAYQKISAQYEALCARVKAGERWG
jgi:glycosyltransferase involved in cell wall biosynthesis